MNLFFFYLVTWRHLVAGACLGFLGYTFGATAAILTRMSRPQVMMTITITHCWWQCVFLLINLSEFTSLIFMMVFLGDCRSHWDGNPERRNRSCCAQPHISQVTLLYFLRLIPNPAYTTSWHQLHRCLVVESSALYLLWRSSPNLDFSPAALTATWHFFQSWHSSFARPGPSSFSSLLWNNWLGRWRGSWPRWRRRWRRWRRRRSTASSPVPMWPSLTESAWVDKCWKKKLIG